MKIRAEIILACVALGLSPGAGAELADRGKPVQVEADNIQVDDLRKVAVYLGNVVLTQGSLKIEADRIDVRQDDKGFAFGEAQGVPVRFQQKLENSPDYIRGAGNRVDYDANREVVHLIGTAWLQRGEDEIRGQRILYDMRSEQYRAEGSVQGVGEGRVRAIIRPRGEKEAQP
jgi:lipopolysaccharide export system protein LptA